MGPDNSSESPALRAAASSPGTQDDAAGRTTFEVPFLATILVLGTVGNVIVFAVYTRRRYRRSNAALYILNLALGDVLSLVVTLFHITEFFKGTWPLLWRTDAQCKVHRYFRFVAFDLTVANMVAIAVDRYFAVVHPLRFRLTFTARRTRVICVVIWYLAMLAAIPAPLMFETNFNNNTAPGIDVVTYRGKLAFACKVITPFGPWWSEYKSVYLNVVLFYIPAIVSAVIYVCIIVSIRRTNTRTLQESVQVSSAVHDTHLRRRSWRSARTLLAVFVAFVVCYGSLATYNVLSKYTPENTIPAAVYNVCLLLPLANSCLNPIIYSFINPSFRKACRELMCRKRKRVNLALPKYSGTGSTDAFHDSRDVVLKTVTNGKTSYCNSQTTLTNQGAGHMAGESNI